jgi:signal transduction histidine kinase
LSGDPSPTAFSALGKAPPPLGPKRDAVALLCYGLLIVAWIVDLLTPQLFIAAILFNGPIALSSLALSRQLTTNLVIAAELGNAIAGYVNGLQAGNHWDTIAVGDRFLLAASFVLVGFLSIRTQEYAREAGASAGRMRQIEIEKALRGAAGRVRETLNVELVQRAILRESVALLGASQAMLIARETAFGPPLVLWYADGDADVSIARRALSTEIASLAARASENPEVFAVTGNDVLGRLTLDALGASEALVTPIATSGAVDYILIASVSAGKVFVSDARATLTSFSEQAAIALEQARLFAQLGERNEEIAHQKDELADRSDVIRDIVYALAHDLRTPLAAAHVTMNQALSGAYGELPERYRGILGTTLAANDDERRIVETLLLVARYEAGESSTVREAIPCGDLVTGVVEEFQPVSEIKGVELRADVRPHALVTLGDPHEIRRAIVNLVANALDATPRGGHVLARCSADERRLVIAVEDDGYGVAPERRRTLFERFGGGHFRGGTGLGLYIVRRIVEKHGGTVAYATREPQGSIFTMTLPTVQA